MDDLTFWLAAGFAAVFIGMAKGGLPVIGALAVPTLSLVMSPVAAAGLLLPVYVAADAVGVFSYRKHFDSRVVRIMLVAMPIGVLAGYLTANAVSEGAVTIVLGLIGAVFAATLLLRRAVSGPPREPRWGPGLFWGAISGFTSFVAHAGAVPYQVFALPLRMSKMVFAGTVALTFAYINVVKLLPYALLGQINQTSLKTAGVLMIPAALSVLVGVRIVRILPEKLFFYIVTVALLLLSLKLIWDGTGRL